MSFPQHLITSITNNIKLVVVKGFHQGNIELEEIIEQQNLEWVKYAFYFRPASTYFILKIVTNNGKMIRIRDLSGLDINDRYRMVQYLKIQLFPRATNEHLFIYGHSIKNETRLRAS